MRELLKQHRGAILHWSMEIVVVVIGVLLALSVQQWAEDRASHQRARDAEARIRQELFAAGADVAERIAVHGCLKQRLTELAAGVSGGDPNWRPTAMLNPAATRLAFAPVYRTPVRTLRSDAFRGAVSGGDLASLSPERLGSISDAYTMLDRIGARNEEEVSLASGLGALQFPSARTSAERSDILATLTRLDQLNHLQRLVAEQHLAQVRSIGFVATGAEIAGVRRAGDIAEWIADGRAKYGQCFDAKALLVIDPRFKPDVAR